MCAPAGSTAELALGFSTGWLADVLFGGDDVLNGAELAIGANDRLFRATRSGGAWTVAIAASLDGAVGLAMEGGMLHVSEWATATVYRLEADDSLTAVADGTAGLNWTVALDGKFVAHPWIPGAWLLTAGDGAVLQELPPVADGSGFDVAWGFTDSIAYPGDGTFPSDVVLHESVVLVADGTGVHRISHTRGEEAGGHIGVDTNAVLVDTALAPFERRDESTGSSDPDDATTAGDARPEVACSFFPTARGSGAVLPLAVLAAAVALAARCPRRRL